MDEKYMSACSGLACMPIPAVVERLSQHTAGQTLSLAGNGNDMFDNRLSDVQIVALTEALEGQNVAALDLSFNEFSNTGTRALAQLIQANTDLTFLNLASNNISAEGAALLANALAQPDCRLQGLVLNDNALCDDGMVALAEALKTNTSLELLHANNTSIAEKGIIALCTTLAEHNRTVRALQLDAPLLQRPQHDTATHLARALSANAMLSEVSLAKHGMVDSCLEVLVQFGLTAKGCAVSALSLRCNRLSPLAGPALQQALSTQRFTLLDCSANRLGDDGARCIANSLPSCSQLRELDMRSNAITDDGLVALLQAAQRCPSLQRLSLAGNEFGQGAAAALQEALAALASSSTGLKLDVVCYTVDGRRQVALA